MTLTRQELRDLDLAWLATDSAGLIAAFLTGGVGPVPDSAMVTIEGAEQTALALPESSDCELSVNVPDPSSFVALANRGLFVYDWADVHRTTSASSNMYELVAVPTNPLRLSAAPPDVQRTAETVTLLDATFGSPTVRVNTVVV